MEKSVVRPVVRCEETNASLFRPDTQGRGVWIWCRGHHREELKTWKELGITRELVERLTTGAISHMSALPPTTAQQILQQWHDEGKMPGFFRWLEKLGRKDKEVKEFSLFPDEIKQKCDPSLLYDGVLPLKMSMPPGCQISVTFMDNITEQKHFTSSELVN